MTAVAAEIDGRIAAGLGLADDSERMIWSARTTVVWR